eukprot:6184251-Pleurochrysis_carterae.AAC.1
MQKHRRVHSYEPRRVRAHTPSSSKHTAQLTWRRVEAVSPSRRSNVEYAPQGSREFLLAAPEARNLTKEAEGDPEAAFKM